MIKPTSNHRVTSPFGWRDYNGVEFHNGADYGANVAGVPGDPIRVIAPGTVKRASYDQNGYGKYVVVEHDSHCTLYAHLQEIHVGHGDVLMESDRIGLMGSTGASTGPHLHFEVRRCKYHKFWEKRRNGVPRYAIDPYAFFLYYMDLNSALEDFKNARNTLDSIHALSV